MKKYLSLFLAACFSAQSTWALSIDWTGGYRAEYIALTQPSLSSDNSQSKSYALNYLYLQPKIIGSDGLNIVSRFDIMPNQTAAYKNSQVGSLLGGGLNDGGSGTGTNASSQNQNSSALQVSQLYLNVSQEFGSLLVGRAPIEFGLGITHNAGRGAFDHWIDTKDMVAMKFMVDNLSVTPIIGRVVQNDFGGGIGNDQIYLVEYNNKDIGARTGVFHQTRTLGSASNDLINDNNGTTNAGAAELPWADNTKTKTGVKIQTVNVFLERVWPTFEFKLEASFLTGNSGLYTNTSSEITYNAYAIVSEMKYQQPESKWAFSSQLGAVSGDNPDTKNVYEGYQLDRNYDLGLLMFNHRLGQSDILGTKVIHANDTKGGNNLSLNNSVDDEAVSNAFFFAPAMTYSLNEKMDIKSKAIFAQLMNAKSFNVAGTNLVDTTNNLGIELNAELVYKPRERVTWSTGLGVLLPGAAWKAGQDLDNQTAYGISTKAAITF